jgi:hypothetical protein
MGALQPDLKPGTQLWNNMVAEMTPGQYREFMARWYPEGETIELPEDAVREIKEVPKLEAPKGE